MAGRFSIEAVFKAIDKVTAPVSKMQNRVLKFTRTMRKGMNAANRSVNKLIGGMAKGAGKILKFGGALAGIGAAATVAAINNVAGAADELAKESRRLKFPIEELQEWKFIGEQSGVSTSLLSKSLGAFSKRLGEAKTGTGPLAAGLKKLNPELLKQLNNSESVADAFDLYIKAIRASKSATEQAALANAGFSRSGLSLVNIAHNSADAIEAMKKEQQENGVITQKQAEAAEAYGDAVNSLKKSLGGLIQGVIVPMLPAITKTLRVWREWIIANKGLIQTKIIGFFTTLKENIFNLVKAVIRFNSEYNIGELLASGLEAAVKFADFMSRNGAVILRVAAVLGTLIAVFKIFVGVMTAVNLVMALNPIGLIVLGIAALILAVAAAIIWWDELKSAFLSIVGPILESVALLAGPIGWLIGTAAFLIDAWEPIKGFFADLWEGIVSIFDSALARVMVVIEAVKNAAGFIAGIASSVTGGIAGFFGGDDEDEQTAGAGAQSQVVSPQDRVARSIEEKRESSSAEITIRDETKRAAVTKGKLSSNIQLQPSGAF